MDIFELLKYSIICQLEQQLYIIRQRNILEKHKQNKLY